MRQRRPEDPPPTCWRRGHGSMELQAEGFQLPAGHIEHWGCRGQIDIEVDGEIVERAPCPTSWQYQVVTWDEPQLELEG